MTRTVMMLGGLAGLLAMLGLAAADWARASATSSEWGGHKTGRARLVSGMLPADTVPGGPLYAGIHIKLEDGWKTYWRQPGDSGVPPQIDWAGSVNLAEARVLYPVPRRLPEAGMISLGYNREVVLPVAITAQDPTKPVELKLAFAYGVCKDICIPVEARLSLSIAPDAAAGEAGLIGAYLARVPLASGAGRPSLASFAAELTGPAPRLVIEAVFPKGSDGADALIEVPGGELAPLPVITERRGRDGVRFEARFTSADEAKRFAGKPLLITLVSTSGQAEVRVPAKP